MRLFYKLLYGISTILTVFCFMFAYTTTQTEGPIGGNGNVGLFLFYFTFPFWMYFLYATIEYGMKMFSTKSKKLNWMFISGTLGYSLLIWSIVFTKASKIATELSTRPEFGYQVGLLQSYTNGLFFNLFTFISVVGLCLAIGALWSMKRKKQSFSNRNTTD